ncbi:restriction endonuclease subunit S [Salmonella enterica]|uniref:S-CspCI protein n=2 Tax=Salmonella enterica TaxID=28901 RepID=A0A5Y3Y3H5_SALER|nr:restriction endonuclease subunit S [Salmonella enterica]EBF2452547.1 S-CspCI protein [Salmonella enterica subsp. enterica serovar Poona]ECF7297615.1 S-CspCI protein [Salmonella enterica subsp. enterica]ECH7874773.1 S-CspCI protein [Salmonella enterica subsp. enterica serovar Rubislaw]ECY3796192.1 S-CspCI protein [Salmonella enterica subsp. enterica serovar Minnesota]EDX4383302.1 S-CspCI protein [Salmonella enterica subsp. enterica serovar O rough]EED3673391.1 S-CspCI protein [Salmonella en
MTKIKDLFTLEYGHSLELNRLVRDNSSSAINFVGRAARNNGVTARVALIPNISPAPAGTITVALGGQGGAGVAFLQPKPYYCGRDVMILTAKSSDMTINEKLWWVTCITANRFRFGFGRQANKSLKNIVLPEPKEKPDWVSLVNLEHFQGIQAPANSGKLLDLELGQWHPFKLNQLFKIRKGNSVSKINFTTGSTPYISASSYSNGITARIDRPPIHDGGTITLSHNGSIGEAFFQPKPFWASGDVTVLYPLGFKLSPSVALFICTVLRKEKYRYNYGRKWRKELMESTVIKLPANNHQPDFDKMEKYINRLAFSSQIYK